MANPEHLKILKQGLEAWNACRKDNPDAAADLMGADLSRAGPVFFVTVVPARFPDTAWR